MKKASKPNTKKTVNIFFTSIGNKVALVESFKEAYKFLRISGKTVSVDMDPFSAGLYKADAGYLVPSLDSLGFLDRVKEICNIENISAILPTRDEDLLFFSKHKKYFENLGIKVIVSDYRSVSTCADKWKFFLHLKDKGIPAIKTWLKPDDKLTFPCIVKPRSGKGGLGVRKIKNKIELKKISLKKNIIQENIEGTEYTVDYFADLAGRPICVVPRVRLRISGGESKVGVTKNEKEMVDLCKKLGRSLGLVAHNTIQCFKLKDGGIKFLEINPRFGGGASLGRAAGCHSPEYIISLLAGKKIKPKNKFVENLVMIRYSQDVFLPYEKIIDF